MVGPSEILVLRFAVSCVQCDVSVLSISLGEAVSANRTAGILVRVSTTCILWRDHLSLVTKGGAPEFGILFRILFQIRVAF